MGSRETAVHAVYKVLHRRGESPGVLILRHHETLTDADWRYQELLEQLKTMTNALPAPAEPAVSQLKRWWWPFR